mmetsp:Transcript_372/g.695  ORF Transcript_372/g.695 Transcript_372/m.695 type:complete len:231 (+) Transcript_372:34-726(+)|eukprot:CAMPEP_0175140908 /NCGR_PEP_ID=MMETSP0087-20121206/11784_1 /TAXON_ID=136419 /ORGANISM="Unknown Unknown, Strain D1" /LENGTH=230 /DNA_ID=CAMNT_0016424211 /DNA_START=32 /DNA_END=724 /DNA_ORIENTATION=+
MELASKQLGRTFEVKLAELDVLENKMQKKLKDKFTDDKLCPTNLLQRLRTIASALPELYEQTRDMAEKKDNIIARLQQLTVNNTKSFVFLQNQCGIDVVEEQDGNSNKSADTKPEPVLQEQQASQNRQLEFVEVSQDQFERVSTTVRGRTPLDMVNATYSTIFNHFVENPESPPLTIAQLTLLGAKVAGLKGQNTINTLRNLKLIEVSKLGMFIPALQRRRRKGSRKKLR